METRVTFDLRAQTVTIDGSGEALTRLFEVVRDLAPNLEVRVLPAKAAAGNEGSADDSSAPTGAESTKAERFHRNRTMARLRAGVRQYVSPYAPRSTVDRIAVIASYMAACGEPHFTSGHMARFFEACGYDVPSNMGVALHDAERKAHALARVGRNLWTLTPAGSRRVDRLERGGPLP